MASPIPALIETWQKAVPGLRAHISPDWGRNSLNHRCLIRENLAQTLNLNEKEKSAVLSFRGPVSTSLWSVSISHSLAYGGWVAIPLPQKIGLDIEKKERIRMPLVERISEAIERAELTLPEAIWCAKEAGFKAMVEHQPSIMAQIRIHGWTHVSPHDWQFRIVGVPQSFGFVSHWDEDLFAICTL